MRSHMPTGGSSNVCPWKSRRLSPFSTRL